MKISYMSLGCKVNEYESVAIINEFLAHGFELASFDSEADVYIINTCTVTSTSDAKSRKMIRQATKRNPGAVVAVMGCYSQLNPEAVKTLGADIILGTKDRHRLYELVADALKNKNKHYLIEDISKEKAYEEIKINRYLNHTRGFIKIEDGCNNFCSYCAIPYARGRVRSRKAEDVLAEIQALTEQGMKELVLSGINTGAYGKDLADYEFPDLLEDIIKETKNLGRIRISSLEVTEITPRFLQVLADHRRYFCHHFHIPLQNGSAGVLKMMNRKYDPEFYLEKITALRALFPDANITTDYMVGFPGETTAMFEEGMDFVRKVNFGEMHIFPYSRRPHTKAFDLPNQVDEISKRFRVNELLNLNRENALNYRRRFNGRELEVLVERNTNGLAYGHTSNYLEVEFKSVSAQNNDLVWIRLEKADYPLSLGKEVDHV
jgi:threonylcarbamoyladenosine tRNA methylthiotransferase MtaB